MSFDSTIGLNQIDATMDQIEIQHRQILLTLDNIYSVLIYGDQQETEYAGLIFILYNKLKHYWYNIPIPKIIKTQNSQDKIEYYLSTIADFN